MMLYATPEEFIASVPEHLLLQLTGSDDEPDAAAIQNALLSASATMDGYIGSRYTLPLSTVPETLKVYCVDIALYYMMRLRALGDIEDTRQRYTDAIAFLKDLVRGLVSLGLPEDSAAPPSAGPSFNKGSSIMKGLDY